MGFYNVLKMATVNPAEYLGRQHESGTVGVGKAADLVVLADNPLEKISNALKIFGVMRNGKWFDQQALEDEIEKWPGTAYRH